MTKKSAKHSVKGKTLTYLQKKSTEWKSTVSKDADQIDNAKSMVAAKDMFGLLQVLTHLIVLDLLCML